MKTVAYASPYVPPEWIAAHDLAPLRLQPDGAAAYGPVPPTAGICPYMRAFVNQCSTDATLSGMVLTTVCDQMRRGYDQLRTTDTPAFCFNVPSTWQTPSAIGLYLGELERLSRFLVTLGGIRPGDDVLATTIQNFQAHRRNATDPGRTSAATIPIAITGGPRTRLDCRLVDFIEAEGGHIVLDATESGTLAEPPPLDPEQLLVAPLQALAEAYLQKLPGISRRPNDALFAWLAAQVERTGAAGVVLLRYVWCDLWHAEVARIRDTLDVPLLDVDLDGEDPLPRNRMRIQAFMEGFR